MSSKTAAIIRLATENGVNVDIVSGAHHGAPSRTARDTSALRASSLPASMDGNESPPSRIAGRRSLLSNIGSRNSGTLSRRDEIGRRERDPELGSRVEDRQVILHGDDPSTPPGMDGAPRQSELPSEAAGSEPFDHHDVLESVLHARNRTNFSHALSMNFSNGRPDENFVRLGTMSDTETIPKRLRAMRESLGMSKRDFAEAAGMPLASYNYYEGTKFKASEIRPPTRDIIIKTLIRLGVPEEKANALHPTPASAPTVTSDLAVILQQIVDEIRGLRADLTAGRDGRKAG